MYSSYAVYISLNNLKFKDKLLNTLNIFYKTIKYDIYIFILWKENSIKYKRIKKI